MGNTLIQISDELWEKLNSKKDRNTKSFEEVIWKLLEIKKNDKE